MVTRDGSGFEFEIRLTGLQKWSCMINRSCLFQVQASEYLFQRGLGGYTLENQNATTTIMISRREPQFFNTMPLTTIETIDTYDENIQAYMAVTWSVDTVRMYENGLKASYLNIKIDAHTSGSDTKTWISIPDPDSWRYETLVCTSELIHPIYDGLEYEWFVDSIGPADVGGLGMHVWRSVPDGSLCNAARLISINDDFM